MVVEGFTSNVDHFMALADFFIGKPGPGSISEALQFSLPVIVERNGRTMPQERYNTEWILENRVGIVLPSFAEIASGVDRLLDPANFAELSRNAQNYSNQALLEVPAILDTIFQQHAASIISFDASLCAEAWTGLT
jgi:1,2-diacylglycerol 3-beta-galactosyltransferase